MLLYIFPCVNSTIQHLGVEKFSDKYTCPHAYRTLLVPIVHGPRTVGPNGNANQMVSGKDGGYHNGHGNLANSRKITDTGIPTPNYRPRHPPNNGPHW